MSKSKSDATKSLTAVPSKRSEDIYIVTVYSPHEATTYLLDEYLENPTKAKVLRHLKYQKSPVVRLEQVNDLELDKPLADTKSANPQSRAEKRLG